ncbi:MAG: DNA topoisomerase, partial [Gemmatimonadota bacterium]
QEAAKRLRFSARRTMSTAQRLYEGVELGSRGAVGLITYMRTDSTRVSAGAAMQARRWVEEEMGTRYLPSSPRLWGGKDQKGAQGAHEAIRPTDTLLLPDQARRFLDQAGARLYELIWLRFVASQMSPTIFDTTTVDFEMEGEDGRSFLFRATGSVVKFDGFTRLYSEATERGDHRRLDDLAPLPDIQPGDRVSLDRLVPGQHFTQPPARFSEASLVKELEKKGIGRPSTYAQILSTIRDRGYVDLDERRFVPTPLGDTVSRLLVRVFPELFDVAFTSRMEGELDRVEEGEVDWRTVLRDFYPPFRERLEEGKSASEEIVREILAAEGEECEKCGSPMLVKWNRHGRFLGCSSYPECRSTRPLDAPGEIAEDVELGEDPASGESVWLKSGPYGPYVQLGEPREGAKPPRASLPKGKEPSEVTLDLALALLSLPRELGTDPDSGQPMLAGLGRYGPYVNRGREYRNLDSFEQIFRVTLEQAVELFRQRAGPGVLRNLGANPKSGGTIELRDGRYGPYVTDGELNASLPKGADPDAFDLEAAIQLLETSGKKPRSRRGRTGRGGKGGRRGGRSGRGKGSAGGGKRG